MDPLGHSAFQKRNHRIDGLRHLAAVGVIFTHSYKLSIDGGNDPLHDLFGLNASYLSLGLFFSISGFLVTGLSGKIRIQISPPRFTKRVIATRAASSCLAVIFPHSCV